MGWVKRARKEREQVRGTCTLERLADGRIKATGDMRLLRAVVSQEMARAEAVRKGAA